MNKQVIYDHLGGFPLDQDVLNHMQRSYTDAFSGIARLCGDKTILTGVELVAGNVSAGWISYNGELIPFIAGAYGAQVVIEEMVTAAIFEDNAQHDIEITKYATCGAVGAFPFADLVPLLSLQNVWLPGDIKEIFISNGDIAALFDVDGYGLGKYKGWRQLSKAYPNSAGKVSVNHNPADADFDECGKFGGAKTHTLTRPQLPHFKLRTPLPGATAGAGGITFNDGNSFASGKYADSDFLGDDQPHNNLQPYFVTLKIVKI